MEYLVRWRASKASARVGGMPVFDWETKADVWQSANGQYMVEKWEMAAKATKGKAADGQQQKDRKVPKPPRKPEEGTFTAAAEMVEKVKPLPAASIKKRASPRPAGKPSNPVERRESVNENAKPQFKAKNKQTTSSPMPAGKPVARK